MSVGGSGSLGRMLASLLYFSHVRVHDLWSGCPVALSLPDFL
jgi:hypothetical protein